MNTYLYNAYDESGAVVKGFVEAEDAGAARENIRSRNLLLTSLSQKNAKKHCHLTQAILYQFTFQLGQLLRAQLPLHEALHILSEQENKYALNRIILSLKIRVRQGASFCEALDDHPQNFSRSYCAMVKAGENSGTLGETLEHLARIIEQTVKLRKNLINGLLYPAFVLGIASIAITTLFLFVVPTMEPLFEGLAVPSLTLVIFSLSHFFRQFWWMLIICIFVASFVFIRSLRSQNVRQTYTGIILKIPGIKTLLLLESLVRFTRILSTMLCVGTPVLEAFRYAKESFIYIQWIEALNHVEVQVRQGQRLSQELKKIAWMPSLISNMFAVSEESGNLAEISGKLAEMYEQNFEKKMTRLVTLLTPVALVFTGILVGIVILAVLLPLSDVSFFVN